MNIEHRTFNIERQMGKNRISEETEELIKVIATSTRRAEKKQNDPLNRKSELISRPPGEGLRGASMFGTGISIRS